MPSAARPKRPHPRRRRHARRAGRGLRSRPRPGPPWLRSCAATGSRRSQGSDSRRRTTRSGASRTSLPLARAVFALRSATRSRSPSGPLPLELEARLGTIGFSASEPRLAFVNGRLVRRTVGHASAGSPLRRTSRRSSGESPELVERTLVASAAARPRRRLRRARTTRSSTTASSFASPPASGAASRSSSSTCRRPRAAPRKRRAWSHTRNLVVLRGEFVGHRRRGLPRRGRAVVHERRDARSSSREDARLNHVKLQLEGREAFHVGHLCRRARGGRALGVARLLVRRRLVRNEITMSLSRARGAEHRGQRPLLRERPASTSTATRSSTTSAPRADSVELYKGDPRRDAAAGSFDGKIVVRAGRRARRTRARRTAT